MATRAAILLSPGPWWKSPAMIDGLLGYAVAMAVEVAVLSRAGDGRPDSWPAYVFALGFGLILLIRRRHPVQVLIITSLGICAYYALQYPPIGLALPAGRPRRPPNACRAGGVPNCSGGADQRHSTCERRAGGGDS